MKVLLVTLTCLALCHAQAPATRTKSRRGPPPSWKAAAPPASAGAPIKYRPFAPPPRRNDVKDVRDNFGRRLPVLEPAPLSAYPPPPSPMIRGPPPPRRFVNPPIPRNPLPPVRTKSIGFIGRPIVDVPPPMVPVTDPPTPPPTYPPQVYEPPSPDANKEEEEES
ncbi:hypothetical protein MAR_007338 [Mya arenaria]|uniref:Uncharacterized protein n=2 Tax=Mya arenaria TaxID=6604 RepID=A0ABY7DB27_MYAAR|nr:uncharacterized protein LOC128237258 isoform X2 [Mya arenaria]XP_052808598.1 uncharacterized protein LOC128237258 isoform X2 [Mya arenaria]WAQ94867.1 hypothetical protein MAR_007338 [Mya arenaria]